MGQVARPAFRPLVLRGRHGRNVPHLDDRVLGVARRLGAALARDGGGGLDQSREASLRSEAGARVGVARFNHGWSRENEQVQP